MLLGNDPVDTADPRDAWTRRQSRRYAIVGASTGFGSVLAFGILVWVIRATTGVSATTGIQALVVLGVGALIGGILGLFLMKKIVSTPPGAGHLGSANLAIGAMSNKIVDTAKKPLSKASWKQDWDDVKGERPIKL